jgi:hypothetical protein
MSDSELQRKIKNLANFMEENYMKHADHKLQGQFIMMVSLLKCLPDRQIKDWIQVLAKDKNTPEDLALHLLDQCKITKEQIPDDVWEKSLKWAKFILSVKQQI